MTVSQKLAGLWPAPGFITGEGNPCKGIIRLQKGRVGYSQAGYSQRLFTVWAWPVSATGFPWRGQQAKKVLWHGTKPLWARSV